MTRLPLDRPAYLGLDRDPAWRDLVAGGLARYGTHFAGSRRAAYCPAVYGEAEAALATWTSAPAALTMSSASLASATLVEALASGGFAVLAGPLAHAAWRRPGLVEAGASREAWRARARELLAAGRSVALVTDRVCALRAREADVAWIGDLAAGAADGGGRIALVVDDSHALGALRDGRGSYAAYRAALPPAVAVVTLASLGKAFSVPGAVVAGAAWAVEVVRASVGFGGASPLPPAYAHALAAGLRGGGASLVAQRLRRLRDLVREVEGLGIAGPHVAGHPVFRVDDARQRGALLAGGIGLSEIAYPTPASPVASRLVLRADGGAGVVEALGAALATG